MANVRLGLTEVQLIVEIIDRKRMQGAHSKENRVPVKELWVR